jgi:uncharacterized protein YciW
MSMSRSDMPITKMSTAMTASVIHSSGEFCIQYATKREPKTSAWKTTSPGVSSPRWPTDREKRFRINNLSTGRSNANAILAFTVEMVVNT